MERKGASGLASFVDLTRLLFWLTFYQNSPLPSNGPLSRAYERCVLLRSDYLLSSFELDIQGDRPQVKKEDKVKKPFVGFPSRCQF